MRFCAIGGVRHLGTSSLLPLGSGAAPPRQARIPHAFFCSLLRRPRSHFLFSTSSSAAVSNNHLSTTHSFAPFPFHRALFTCSSATQQQQPLYTKEEEEDEEEAEEERGREEAQGEEQEEDEALKAAMFRFESALACCDKDPHKMELVFEEMQRENVTPTPHMYTRLLRAYQGRDTAALLSDDAKRQQYLLIFERMQRDNVPFTTFVWKSLLRLFREAKDYTGMVQCFTQMESSSSNVVDKECCSILISSAPSLSEALEQFQRLGKKYPRNFVSSLWLAPFIQTSFLSKGDVKGAHDTISLAEQSIGRRGRRIWAFVADAVLPEKSKSEQAIHLLDRLLENKTKPSSTFLHFAFAQCIKDKNVISAWQIYQDIHASTAYVPHSLLSNFIELLLSSFTIDQLLPIFEQLSEANIELEYNFFVNVIIGLGRQGKVVQAFKVLEFLRKRDVFGVRVINALLQVCNECGAHDKAVELYTVLEEHELKPNSETFVQLIHASQDTKKAWQLYRLMLTDNPPIYPSTNIFDAIFGTFSGNESLEEVDKVLEEVARWSSIDVHRPLGIVMEKFIFRRNIPRAVQLLELFRLRIPNFHARLIRTKIHRLLETMLETNRMEHVQDVADTLIYYNVRLHPHLYRRLLQFRRVNHQIKLRRMPPVNWREAEAIKRKREQENERKEAAKGEATYLDYMEEEKESKEEPKEADDDYEEDDDNDDKKEEDDDDNDEERQKK
ncbi:Ribonuclease E/G [Balamuthia mandrillaris]